MKDRLFGTLIGAAAVAAALAIYGFGSAQSESVGRFRVESAPKGDDSRVYLVDTVTGETWYEVGGAWAKMRRPTTRDE